MSEPKTPRELFCVKKLNGCHLVTMQLTARERYLILALVTAFLTGGVDGVLSMIARLQSLFTP